MRGYISRIHDFNSGHETFDALLTIAISPKLCVDSAIILLPAAVPNYPAICQLHSPLAALLPECGHTLWPECGHTLWPESGHSCVARIPFAKNKHGHKLWPQSGHTFWICLARNANVVATLWPQLVATFGFSVSAGGVRGETWARKS